MEDIYEIFGGVVIINKHRASENYNNDNHFVTFLKKELNAIRQSYGLEQLKIKEALRLLLFLWPNVFSIRECKDQIHNRSEEDCQNAEQRIFSIRLCNIQTQNN